MIGPLQHTNLMYTVIRSVVGIQVSKFTILASPLQHKGCAEMWFSTFILCSVEAVWLYLIHVIFFFQVYYLFCSFEPVWDSSVLFSFIWPTSSSWIKVLPIPITRTKTVQLFQFSLLAVLDIFYPSICISRPSLWFGLLASVSLPDELSQAHSCLCSSTVT